MSYSVLFVCTGNICRSPSAEAIFRAKVRQTGLDDAITCDSAGTTSYHCGSPADSRMSLTAAQRGYKLDSVSRRIRMDDLFRYDHIIAMDQENLASLEAMCPGGQGRARVSLLCDFARHHQEREVPDPYYGGQKGFEKVLDIIEDACDGLLEELSATIR